MKLYHLTDKVNTNNILKKGLLPNKGKIYLSQDYNFWRSIFTVEHTLPKNIVIFETNIPKNKLISYQICEGIILEGVYNKRIKNLKLIGGD